MSDQPKQVLSCIQPTGHLHLGNYFGAIKNWVDLQKKYACVFGVVDYHAMTMPYDIKKLRNNTWELVVNLVSVGVDPNNIFIQSLIPEHAELCWILNCFCSYGRLTNMTQFKDKSSSENIKNNDHFVSAGLLDYPVLQVADILIYRADYVPVGKDQEQHLELSREIAQRFNFVVKKEYFSPPQALLTETPKIKSTADPHRKMSKSAGEKHYINVFAPQEKIMKQIKSAVTDSGLEKSDQMSPGVDNLFQLIKASENITAYENLMEQYLNDKLKYAELKQVTAQSIIDYTEPFRINKVKYSEKEAKKALKYQIKESSAAIRKRAQQTLSEVKEMVGLLNIKY